MPLEEPEPEYPAEDGPLTILYEDDHLLAVDKPAGMLIHPSHSKFDGTLANYVVGYYQKTGQKCAFHPVTRLDRDTFGIVLLAKNSHAHALMQQCDLQKTYHALVLGNWAEEKGIIDGNLSEQLFQNRFSGAACGLHGAAEAFGTGISAAAGVLLLHGAYF